MSLPASVMDILAWAKDEDRDEILGAIALAGAKAVTSKTYMRGTAQLIDAISDPVRNAGSFTEQLAGSFVPAFVGGAARILDPVRREIDGMADAIRARTPGLSADLPPKRDLWGRIVLAEGAWLPWFDPRFAQAISPARVSTVKDSPIDAELLRLRLKIDPVRENTAFDGVTLPLEPKELDRYAFLQGQGGENPRTGKNLYDSLNGLVAGEGPLGQRYQALSDDGKGLMIRDFVQGHRALAREALLKEFPKLRDLRDQLLKDKAAAGRPDTAPPPRAIPSLVPQPAPAGPARPGNAPVIR
jgi:hypothetical protein